MFNLRQILKSAFCSDFGGFYLKKGRTRKHVQKFHNNFFTAALFIMLSTSTLISQVTSTAATGGNTLPDVGGGGSYTTLSGPILTETIKNELMVGTITLTAPPGFEFNIATPTFTLTKAGHTDNMYLAMTAGTHISTVLTFEVTNMSGTGNGKKGPGVVTFENIQVRPTSMTPANGDIVWAGTSYTPGGNIGALTMEIPPATKVVFAQEPTNTSAGTTISPNVSVQLQDANSNIVNSSGISITLEPSSTTLNGTLTQNTNSSGLATFNDLTMETAGTGYTLSASSSGLTGTISSSFNINPTIFSTSNSTISVSSDYIANNGTSTSTITIQLIDQYGNSLAAGGSTVGLNTSAGTLLSTVSDAGDGSYTQVLQSSITEEYATITVTVDAQALTATGTVGFTSATTVWTSNGSNSTDWADGTNWTGGVVPTSTDTVLIPETPLDGTADPTISSSTSISGLITETNSTLTLTGTFTFTVNGDVSGEGTVTGDANVILDVKGDVDVAGLTVGTLTLSGTGNQSIKRNYTALINMIMNKTGGLLNVEGDIKLTGSLTLTLGTLVMNPGSTMDAATTTNTGGVQRFQQTLTGSPGSHGWRLLSSPVAGTYADLLDAIYVQWSTGTGADTLSPSVLYYDETYTGNGTYPRSDNWSWRKPASSSEILVAGRGLFVYAFGNTTDDLYNISFPVTLEVDGSEIAPSGGTEIDFGVTYTTEGDLGWNLVGNPFASAIDWGLIGDTDWTKTNMTNSIYVWDASATSYLTWNGITGSFGDVAGGDSLIAPFQGFWVKANAASPVLKVNYSAKTGGGSFIGKITESSPSFYISAGTGNFLEKIYFMFSEDGKVGNDPYDAYWLTPPIDSYLEFNAAREGGDRMVIQSLPLKFGQPIEVPVRVNLILNDQQTDAEIEINWGDLSSLPDGWTISLVDNKTNFSIDLSPGISHSLSKIANQQPLMETAIKQNLLPSIRAKYAGASDYILVIDPGNSFPEIPREIALEQNYPNPFNANTNFSFSLPLESRISLHIYNILGQKIDTLLESELMPAGQHKMNWNAHSLPTGVYFSQMIVGNKIYNKKFLMVK